MHKNNLGLFYESRIVQLTVVVKGRKTTFSRIFFTESLYKYYLGLYNETIKLGECRGRLVHGCIA